MLQYKINTHAFYSVIKKVFLLCLFVAYSVFSINKSWNDDFRAYYQAGRHILSSANVYDRNVVEGGFLYSPFFALLMVPLSYLPQITAATLWYFTNIASLLLALILGLYFNERTAQPVMSWLKTASQDRRLKLILLLSMGLSAKFWLNSIEHGQVNLHLLALVLIAIYSLKKQRVLIGSLFLGTATVIKILPGLFLFYFLLRRQYRFVVLSIFWITLFIFLPGLILGWHVNCNLLAAWFHKTIGATLIEGMIGTGDSNQSVPAMLARFLSNVPAQEKTGASVNFLSLSAQTVDIIIKVSSLLFLLAIAISARLLNQKALNATEKINSRENLALSLVFLTSALLPPHTWKAYFVTSIMAYTTVVCTLTKKRYNKSRRLFILLLATSFGLHTLTSDGIWGWNLAYFFQSYSCITVSMLLLYFAVLMMLLKQSLERSRTVGIA